MSPAATATGQASSEKKPSRRLSLAAQRRRRERRLRRMKRALIAALAIALVVTAGWLIGFSTVLATHTVAVSGTKLLGTDRVKGVAAVPIGLPLARQDTTAIARRVATLTQVASVSVDRRWPHTLSIQVVERQPVVAVRTGEGYLLVDRTGVAFEIVSALPRGVVTVGIDSTDAALLAQAGTIVTEMPAGLREQVAAITAKTPDSFRVTLDSGLTVVWGSADQSALKGQVALLLLKKKPKAIDVSAPHSPAVR
jgi:cell division protein FtsQ